MQRIGRRRIADSGGIFARKRCRRACRDGSAGCHSGGEVVVRVAIYSYTNKDIAQALVKAKKRGVDVRIVADKKSNASGKKYSAATFSANQGIPTALNGRYAIFHHKFAVIDRKHVLLGSFNWTSAAAKRNAEDVVLIRDDPALAKTFTAEWDRLFKEAEVLTPNY